MKTIGNVISHKIEMIEFRVVSAMDCGPKHIAAKQAVQMISRIVNKIPTFFLPAICPSRSLFRNGIHARNP